MTHNEGKINPMGDLPKAAKLMSNKSTGLKECCANPEIGTSFTLSREEDPLSRWSAGLLPSSSAV
jgi:hypothetical protein